MTPPTAIPSLDALEQALADSDLSPTALARLLGELERLKAVVWAKMAAVPKQSEPLLTPKAVAARLAVPESWVYEALRTGGLPFTLVGKYKRVSEHDLAVWVAEHKKTLDIRRYVTYSMRRGWKGTGAAS